MVVPTAGALIITSTLLITWAIFSGLWTVTTDQTDSLREAEELQHERLRTSISIISTDVAIYGNPKCSTFAVDTIVANSGDVSIQDFSEMDLLLAYNIDTGSKAAVRSKFVSGNLSGSQWTISAINPDTFGVNIWDPAELMTMRSKVFPLPQPHSLGTVLVATPQGITDAAYVDFDYDGVNDCRYLHNNPTPPTGDTNLQPVLSMDDTLPATITLYSYDQDVDGNPGRTIVKGGIGTAETDTKKYQAWRTGVLSESLLLTGTVAVDLWGAIQQYQLDKAGIVTLFFRDYDGSSYTEIAQGTIYDNDWQAGSTGDLVRKVVLVPGFNYTVPAGNELELKMIVENIAASEMWFAYDTGAYQSLVNLSYTEPTYTTFYYLHNNPTPPVGDTNAQAVLPINVTGPTATGDLFNYDINYDSDAGRILQKTQLGLSENKLQKHQVWRSGYLINNLPLVGDVAVDLWAAIKDFGQAKTGIVTAYLRDYNSGTGAFTEIGHASVYAGDWQNGSSTWVKRSIVVPELNYTVPAGNELELFVIVEKDSADDMWFAYDTTSYPSVIKLP